MVRNRPTTLSAHRFTTRIKRTNLSRTRPQPVVILLLQVTQTRTPLLGPMLVLAATPLHLQAMLKNHWTIMGPVKSLWQLLRIRLVPTITIRLSCQMTVGPRSCRRVGQYRAHAASYRHLLDASVCLSYHHTYCLVSRTRK